MKLDRVLIWCNHGWIRISMTGSPFTMFRRGQLPFLWPSYSANRKTVHIVQKSFIVDWTIRNDSLVAKSLDWFHKSVCSLFVDSYFRPPTDLYITLLGSFWSASPLYGDLQSRRTLEISKHFDQSQNNSYCPKLLPLWTLQRFKRSKPFCEPCLAQLWKEKKGFL